MVWRQFIRYAVSGLVAFGVEYGSFYLLFVVGGMYLLAANALSFCCGLITAFMLNRLWAFSAHEYNKKASHQFGFYATLALVNLFLTLAIVAGLKWLGIKPTVGKLIAMVITSSWNFLLLKFWIFAHA
jgi:putative flippase GtrA